MKKCLKCGYLNQENSSVCLNCGLELEEEDKVNVKKRSKKRIRIIGTVIGIQVFLLLIIAPMLFHFIISYNPVTRTMSGINQFISKEKYDLSISMVTDIDERIDVLTNEITNELHISVDKDKKTFLSALEFQYDTDEIFTTVYVMNEDEVFLDVPKIFDEDEYLFIEYDKEVKEAQEKIIKYLEMIDFSEVDKNTYINLVLDVLDGKIENEFSTVTLQLDEDDLERLTNKILREMKDDEELKKALADNVLNIMKEMKKDNFESIDQDEYEDAFYYFNEKNETDSFEMEWEQIITEIEDEMDYFQDYDVRLEIIIEFGFFNNIKSITIVPEAENDRVELFVKLGEEYRGRKEYSVKEGTDAESMSNEEWFDYVDEISDYLVGYVEDRNELEDICMDYVDEFSYFDDYEEAIEVIAIMAFGAYNEKHNQEKLVDGTEVAFEENMIVQEEVVEEVVVEEVILLEENEYILEKSNTSYLAMVDIVGLNAEMCRLARNEIYARHGRMFNDETLQEYFDKCSWYETLIKADDFDESILNEFEEANRDLILAYEDEEGYR